MGFFDLNIPYTETPTAEKSKSENSVHKTSRLKLCAKAMELGYTGVAYNRSIKGVISDSDYCSIPLFSLSTVLRLAPALASAARLHRDLLGVPPSAPFRQYTRLTVSVDAAVQATALNATNPVLRTYDLVAVRPLSQAAFEQACQVSEVDIIAIDFSEKLPLRLKPPMVEAAIRRGIYFEIMYSGLIADVQSRRQMISNAKLLVVWTRGKNLIFSSAASSVTELRGPYDVANLSSLLGLSMGCGKAALSKNCRSLIANALRKRQCYKEAIKVELMSSGEKFDPKEPFGDWLKWDPISSGEGDLLLDDMAKMFSVSCNASKTVKAIDFSSIVDSRPTHGLQVKELVSGTSPSLQLLDNNKNSLFTAEQLDVLEAINRLSEPVDGFTTSGTNQMSLFSIPSEHETLDCEDYQKSFLPSDSPEVFLGAKEFRTLPVITEDESKKLNRLDVQITPVEAQVEVLLPGSNSEATVPLPDVSVTTPLLLRDIKVDAACNADCKIKFSTPSIDVDLLTFQNEEFEKSRVSDLDLGAKDAVMEEVFTNIDKTNQADISLGLNDVSSLENSLEEQSRKAGHDTVLTSDGVLFVESSDDMNGVNESSNVNNEPLEEGPMDEQRQHGYTVINNLNRMESISGKYRVKQRTSRRPLLFPFTRLLNPVPFKRKARAIKNKNMML